jgi:nucleotide-binding universal stress UspA family protein
MTAPSPWRRILVHLDADGRAAARLEFTARIAAPDTSVLALYACSPAVTLLPLPEGAMMSERLPALDAARRDAARTAFDAWRAAGHQADWDELVAFDLGHLLARRAMLADLSILGQSPLDHAGAASVPPGAAVEVLFGSGRPAIVVPAVGPVPPLDVIAVAWKAKPECARAIAASLPLLAAAQRVVLLAFGGDAAECQATAAYLKLHGVEAEVRREPEEPADVGEAVLSRMADLGAGLLVMGCYGRGRAAERIFGGMTRTILASMTVPVFMAH